MDRYRTEQWDHVDIDFSCKEDCDDPFDLELWAQFESAGKQSVRVPGFYRGDGRWTVRFMPTSAGIWEFATASDITGLNGIRGEVEAGKASPANHGRLSIRKGNSRRLCWEDGTPYFLIGFEADWLALVDAGNNGFENTQNLIDVIAPNGFNHVFMNIYAHEVPWPGDLGRGTRYDFSCPEIWPFGGTNDEPDYDTLNHTRCIACTQVRVLNLDRNVLRYGLVHCLELNLR